MIRRFAGMGVAGVLAIAACNSGGPSSTPSVQFALSTHPTAAPLPGPNAAAPALASEVYTDAGGDTLAFDSVFVVIRKMELKSVSSSGCDTVTTAADGCAELESGPYLLDLPLGTAGAQRVFSVAADTGTYSSVQYEIHRLEAGGDSAFLAAHPGYTGVSIRVVGHFNGAPFTYVTDLDVGQEVTFATPLVVGTGPLDLTLYVDLSGWFRNGGGTLVDPATAATGQTNESLVKDNIKLSFHAFEDSNHDGHDDNAP